MSHFQAEMSSNKMSDDVTMCKYKPCTSKHNSENTPFFTSMGKLQVALGTKEQNDKHFLSRYIHHYRDGNYIAGICVCSDLSLVVFEVPRVSQMTCYV